MADDVTLPGTGAVIVTDDVGGGRQIQLVKLDGGANGASAPVVSGAQASANSLPVVGPNDEFVTVTVDVTRPADTTAYAVDDCISNSTSAPTTFTISNAAKASGGSGLITDMTVLSNNDPLAALQGEIFLFDSAVISPNDNAAFQVSDADARKCIGKIPFMLEDIGNNEFFHAQGINIGFTCVGSADLRFLLRAKNTYVPASGEVFTFRLKIQRLT
ncbi:hypothetical protein G5V57_18680 [Nordella sp. HKS 07]|uniref:hypothetical protein n=1 Tax=Nordella sp. HKS 07 TaxID=2712222 RepID=UPI0013E1E78A|nr:hypothetical protein [Nordella sp. HKS 07]QIG49558.1 hypothetical protein G5V57_18680 [Nordella sp. HKS 07]